MGTRGERDKAWKKDLSINLGVDKDLRSVNTIALLKTQKAASSKAAKEAAEKASIAGNDLEDFYTGLAIALEGMLISPEMLFIVETVVLYQYQKKIYQ